MDRRFTLLAAHAANCHGIFTVDDARRLDVSDRLRLDWLDHAWIERLGNRTFCFAGAPRTWQMTLTAGLGDLGPQALIAGRSSAALQRLDGFLPGPVEFWVPRAQRNRGDLRIVRSSTRPLLRGDAVWVDGLRCMSAERLILDSTMYAFTRQEIHNAIDSAVRMRLVSERRLRQRIVRDLPMNAPHRRRLIGALVDTGGESSLERRFLALIRQAGLPRPSLQRVYRDGTRTLARVDAGFPDGLVVELAGHGTHATRTQRQRDAQRHTELTLRGKRVITFTYDDVYGRPEWTTEILRSAGVGAAA